MTYYGYVQVDEDLIVAEYLTDEDIANIMKDKIDFDNDDMGRVSVLPPLLCEVTANLNLFYDFQQKSKIFETTDSKSTSDYEFATQIICHIMACESLFLFLNFTS